MTIGQREKKQLPNLYQAVREKFNDIAFEILPYTFSSLNRGKCEGLVISPLFQ